MNKAKVLEVATILVLIGTILSTVVYVGDIIIINFFSVRTIMGIARDGCFNLAYVDGLV